MRFFGKSRFSLSSRQYGGARKRLFIGLLSASCFLLCLLLALFLIAPWLVFPAQIAWLAPMSMAFGFAAIGILLWLCLTIVIHSWSGIALPGARGVRHVTVRLLFPLMELLAKFVGLERNRLRRSFIKINNETVLSRGRAYAPESLLLLLPHCIQRSACAFRLVYDVNNCRRCGQCPVGDVLALRDKYGILVAVATGGTIARRLVVQLRPECIVAVACERDLTSGIQDSYPLPVFGVLNQRPHGPCLDTRIPLDYLENVVCFLLGKKSADFSKL
ncbi:MULTISPECIES: DUF116 domain-containing protein [unclassified Desulfovibrio]|uniref:DUF116 domain-containing protein n=1 Tax=unclassified Desulfovibrio TaxID=2593640 RepID=UPI000F5EA46A|nr:MULTISPECIES: DUF116 domain-containing protein [unclassified Desulfovibrio]RRD69898.1 DUF116 domain-containing protein [Desulfovibrio sp. OH1209_COT-279]RRD86478.1 DUF116 domain-containing protein [Desulfovibrio sp. OH1186_COT-070]